MHFASVTTLFIDSSLVVRQHLFGKMACGKGTGKVKGIAGLKRVAGTKKVAAKIAKKQFSSMAGLGRMTRKKHLLSCGNRSLTCMTVQRRITRTRR